MKMVLKELKAISDNEEKGAHLIGINIDTLKEKRGTCGKNT